MTGLLMFLTMAQAIVPIANADKGDPCQIVDSPPLTEGMTRPITASQLAEIADIGSPIPGWPAPAFGVSPDGDQIAVLVSKPNPHENGHCQRLLVLPFLKPGSILEIARGGEFIADDYSLRDFASVKAGWQRANPPQWAPNGRKIAYLRREAGTTQVWLADPEGASPAQKATDLQDDIESFRWTAGGEGLIVASRPGIRAAAEAIADEGRRGYLYDSRFAPQLADRPLPTGKIPSAYTYVSLIDGSNRTATPEEAGLFTPTLPAEIPASAITVSMGPHGQFAWLEAKKPGRVMSPTRLVIAGMQGKQRVCDTSECEGIFELWWSSDGKELLALQRTGWANSMTALLRFESDEPIPQRVLTTDDVIAGCRTIGDEAVCTREGSVRPLQLVAFNPRTGTRRLIYDPNPQLDSVHWGTVHRLRFRNAYGIESFADLVLPPGHREGQRHPLVITGYTSRGFLRGGTGDDVPIQPLAAQGVAVLSYARPAFLPQVEDAKSEIETRTLLDDPWDDRRSVLSTLEKAIELAVQTGAVDPTSIGITGFSDGGASAQFALINSDLFSAASLTTCCEESGAFALVAGPRFTDYLRAMGYPYFEGPQNAFWKPMSLIRNVETISTPLLILAADSEYEGALDVWETYRHRGKPIEMRVFPDETHYRWQPAHRLSTYLAQIDWFSFWLAGRIDCSTARAQQYERWLAMPGAPSRSALACLSVPSATP